MKATDDDPAMRELGLSPGDEHNRLLVANAHPADWRNPDPAPRYNMVVIGAGTAGLVTAAGAAGLGAKVALVERHFMGGDCLNTGCVPSKSVIRASRVLHDIHDAPIFGIQVAGDVRPDFAAVMERMRRIRASISQHDSVQQFRSLGVDLFLGDAHFTSRDTVEVAGKRLRFKKAAITTGARPAVPPIEGLAEANYLTNETVFNLTERPERLLVVGGGPIGCELAQAFSRLGSHVTIIQHGPQFLRREDPDAAQILAKTFEREGIDIHLNTSVKRVVISNGAKLVHLENDGQGTVIETDAILVGTGRVPNVDGLNLDSAGVRYDRTRGVLVNDRLQTSNPNIYAAGDICLQHKFTHAADAAARIVIQNSLFLGRKKFSSLAIPWCTYTDPEIAHVGIHEWEAQQRNILLDTFRVAFREVDRAITDGEEEGFLKIHLKKGTDRILGATIVARHAGEMISEITLAMAKNIGLGAVSNVIHPYPTQSEAIRKAADAYNHTRLTPLFRNLFSRWFCWTR